MRLITIIFVNFSLIGSILTQTPIIISDYSGAITYSSGQYTRPEGAAGTYYYEAIEIRVNTPGTYSFKSISDIDTFGYIYQGNFYPQYPQYNIIAKDDDGATNGQFLVTAELRADITYILVFTSFHPNQIGTFTISASGPDNVFYNRQPVGTTTG